MFSISPHLKLQTVKKFIHLLQLFSVFYCLCNEKGWPPVKTLMIVIITVIPNILICELTAFPCKTAMQLLKILEHI